MRVMPVLSGQSHGRLWWRDTSASGMLNESYGYTRRIGHADELSEPGSIRMDQGMSLQAGDLAVTDGGAHVHDLQRGRQVDRGKPG